MNQALFSPSCWSAEETCQPSQQLGHMTGGGKAWALGRRALQDRSRRAVRRPGMVGNPALKLRFFSSHKAFGVLHTISWPFVLALPKRFPCCHHIDSAFSPCSKAQTDHRLGCLYLTYAQPKIRAKAASFLLGALQQTCCHSRFFPGYKSLDIRVCYAELQSAINQFIWGPSSNIKH